MTCGYLPFGENCEDDYDVQDEIINKILEVPSFIEPEIREVLERLLNKNPEQRSSITYESLKSMSWFKDFDWVYN